MELSQKKALCRIVAQLLITDLVLTDDEGDYLSRLMVELGLDASAQREVIASVNVGQDLTALLEGLDRAHREEILERLHRAAEVDGAVGDGELALIAQVEAALG